MLNFQLNKRAQIGFFQDRKTQPTSMPPKRKRKSTRRRPYKGRSLYMIGGKVRIKVGKKKFAAIPPTALLRHIPISKLRVAARKVIRSTTVQPKGSRKRKSSKRKVTKRAVY